MARGHKNQYVDFSRKPKPGSSKKPSVLDPEPRERIAARFVILGVATRAEWTREDYVNMLEHLALDDDCFLPEIVTLIHEHEGRFAMTPTAHTVTVTFDNAIAARAFADSVREGGTVVVIDESSSEGVDTYYPATVADTNE
jgi:hypothetical protein